MARYKQLLFYAAKLSPLAAEEHKPENKVEGCVSQVCVGGALCLCWLQLFMLIHTCSRCANSSPS